MLNSYIENIYNDINSRIKIELSDLIFYIAYSLYLFKVTILDTMLQDYIPKSIMFLITMIAFGLLLIKILLLSKYSKKNFIIMSILSISACLIYINSSYKNVMFLVLLIIGANNINFKNIVKIFLSVKTGILLIAMAAARLGLIENLIYERNGKFRHSFGSIYPTDFAAGVLFIALAYLYIRSEKLKIRDTVIFVLLGLGIYYFCDARVDSICIFAVALYSIVKIIYNKREKIKINKFFNYILSSSMIICAAFSIIISMIYDNKNKFMLFLNKLLSSRLGLAKKGIEEYGFSLFGQKIDMVGNGATTVKPTNYFFIDSSYLFIALRYGLVILIIFCVLYTVYVNKTINLGNIDIAVIIAIISVNSIIAHRLLDVSYNPFLLMFFATIGVSTLQGEEQKQIL